MNRKAPKSRRVNVVFEPGRLRELLVEKAYDAVVPLTRREICSNNEDMNFEETEPPEKGAEE